MGVAGAMRRKRRALGKAEPQDDWVAIPPVDHPREITYYSVAEKGRDDYRTHWINIGLILEIIAPAELASQGKAGGNGA